MIGDIDFIEKYLLETILHEQEIHQLLNEKKLETQKVQSNTIQASNVNSVFMENTCSEKENILSKEDLKDTRIEHGFKQAFLSLFGQDDDTFIITMFLNMNQLQKQLDKDEFQDDGSMGAFWVLKSHKALDASLVVIESSRTDSEVHDESSWSGNDTDVDDVDIRPIYDEEPMADVQSTAECNVFAIGKQHVEKPEIINEGRVDQDVVQCQVKSPLLDPSLDNKTTEFSNQSLESENICLK
ncbi:hypothetical protein Tco_1448238 [Tanacetum coccineum]